MRLLSLLLLLLLLERQSCASGDVFLTCDEFDQHLFMDSNDPYCTVTGFIVTHSQNVVVKNYIPGNSIRFMKFYDSTLLYVPFHLFETFANLKTLDVSFTSILELTRNTFSAASNLTYLNISNNNLTNIATSVFIGANSLIRLDLSGNKINELNVNAFCGLRALNKLQLSSNKLSNIPKDIFKDNDYLESVSLESNQLSYIEPEVFSRMRRIKEVNLSNNRLLRIHPDTFTEAASLENLLLASNDLHVFQLSNKSIVHQLHLDYNHLTNLTINGTRFVRANYNNISAVNVHQALQLETLELRSNRVANIAHIRNLTALLHLDLSYNPIGQLNVSTFARLKRLRNLYLRGIGLRHLNFGMFSKQSYLEILDLAFNNLTRLNLDVFVPYLTTVRQFFVDGNDLYELQGNRSFSDAFPNLLKLGISRNRFNCSYLHHLLIPPYLAEAVVLNIEPDTSIEETPHIRDVSCVSNMWHEQTPPHAIALGQPVVGMAEADDSSDGTQLSALQQQLRLLRAHERSLALHLFYMKTFFFVVGTIILCGVFALVALKYWKTSRSGRYEGGSIIFHSDGTVNTQVAV